MHIVLGLNIDPLSGGSPGSAAEWLLETGFWNDSGVWKDSAAWVD